MRGVLTVLQIAFAVLLSLVVLLQSKGVGLSETFGGGDGNFYSTKRGIDKFLHIATILLTVLLSLNTLAFAFVA